jgi:hypothetical protein
MARTKVRQLTHTIHLPPAQSELYDGPKAEWLRDVLEYLPNLQSLIVSELPFFDHSALIALRYHGNARDSPSTNGFPTYPLRLLIGTKCANTTSSGLAEALLHLPNLTFLDLSDTTPAKDRNVLSSFRFMRGLKVLKLRHLGLRDDDIEALAPGLNLKIRSLDVRDNRLTDRSIRSLLTHCFHTTNNIHAVYRRASIARQADEDWPSGGPPVHTRILEEFRGDDLDERLVKKLTGAVVGRLASEDLPQSGLSHLYIANNHITMEGVAAVVRTENLHVLDAGSVDTIKALGYRRPLDASISRNSVIPGAEKLVPVLEDHARANLTSLRIHHALVTSPAAQNDDIATWELAGTEVTRAAFLPELETSGHTTRHEISSRDQIPNELDAELPVYELAGSTPAHCYEMPAAPVQGTQPLACDTESAMLEVGSPEVRTGASFAPEVVVCETEQTSTPTVPAFTDPWGSSAAESINSPSQEQQTSKFEEDTATAIAKIVARRQELRHGVKDAARGLLPGMIPSLQTLVLTDIPTTDDPNNTIVTALKHFVSECALETHLASTQACLEEPSLYMPGEPRSSHQQYRANELFGLRHIVLEIASEQQPTLRPRSMSNNSLPLPGPSSSLGHRFKAFDQRNRSSTGDPDTEQFWSAQEDDFTFFGEEECGLPVRDPNLRVPRSVMGQKMAVVEPDGHVGSSPLSSPAPSRLEIPSIRKSGNRMNVVSELAKWRADRKETARRFGGNGIFVEGYWKGDIKVVRPHGCNKGFVDWYGNYFERSYYYP